MTPEDTRFREQMLAELDALHAFARRLDPEHADDLLQDTLTKAWTQRVQLTSVDRLRGWVGRILYRTFLDGRRRWIPEIVSGADVETRPAPSGNPEQSVSNQQLRTRLERALASLPDDQREAILLVDYMGLTFAEAAESMRVAPGTAASRVARGRRTLRSLLIHDAQEMGVTA